MLSAAFHEAPTLEAISQLRRKYPYAAALLTYVAIERILKVHFVSVRHCLSFPQKKLTRGPQKGKSMAAGTRNWNQKLGSENHFVGDRPLLKCVAFLL